MPLSPTGSSQTELNTETKHYKLTVTQLNLTTSEEILEAACGFFLQNLTSPSVAGVVTQYWERAWADRRPTHITGRRRRGLASCVLLLDWSSHGRREWVMHWSVCSRRQVRSPACRPGTSADRPRDAHTHTHTCERATLATAPHWTGNKRRTDSLAPCTTTETKQKQQLRVDHWRVLSAPRPRTPASTTQPHCCRLARRSWSLRPLHCHQRS